MAADNLFTGWCIVELLGHVRIAGRVSEEEHFGSKLGRIDIPDGDTFTTQFFGGGSVYRLTPTTEEIARAVAKSSSPEPAYAWDLRRQLGLIEERKPIPIPDDEEDELFDADDDSEETTY